MMECILPTAPILHEFSYHDHMFSFYNDGIKEAIRDLIITNRVRKLSRSFTLFNYLISCHYDLNDIENGILETHDMYQSYFEKVLNRIDISVGNMMHGLFMSCDYDIDRRKWDWYGDDLIINIDISKLNRGLKNVQYFAR